MARRIDEALLDVFRHKRRCERCHMPHIQVYPHHVFCRGMGGARRLDVAINLIGLCWVCHQLFHDGRIDREQLLRIIARRERMTVEEIVEEIYRLQQL